MPQGFPILHLKDDILLLKNVCVYRGFMKKFNILLDDQYILNLNRESEAFLFRALGNAVNVDVIEKIAETFLSNREDIEHRKVKSQLNLNLNII